MSHAESQARKAVTARAWAKRSPHSPCPLCDCDMMPSLPGRRRDNDATVDHIIPRARGGSNEPDNLRLMCVACNHQRGIVDHCVGALACVRSVLPCGRQESGDVGRLWASWRPAIRLIVSSSADLPPVIRRVFAPALPVARIEPPPVNYAERRSIRATARKAMDSQKSKIAKLGRTFIKIGSIVALRWDVKRVK